MRLAHFITTSILISFFIPSPCLSQTDQQAPEVKKALRPKPSVVKMVDFHLRDGRLVFGKQLSNDKNKITVEEISDSRVVVSTYSKREVDTRTLHSRTVPEYKYYLDLAEYFAGRTWDFIDDPDDFIQAIRCYEKAKHLTIEKRGPDSEKALEIAKEIEKLKADREIWIEQTESRASLKKLEFVAEAEKRLSGLENKIRANTRRVDKNLSDIKADYRRIDRNIIQMKKDISQQYDMMAGQIEANAALLARIDDYLRWRTWRPWTVPPSYGPQRNP